MAFIKRVRIIGFKRFKDTTITFNPDKTILVGDNESGKSTVLEAIDLAMNRNLRMFDLSLLEILFNERNKERFLDQKNIATLPKIIIQIFIGGAKGDPNFNEFYGQNYEMNSHNKEDFGLQFEASFDMSFASLPEIQKQISEGFIPCEYYKLTSITFGNMPFRQTLSPISYTLIDTSSGRTPSFYSYTKSVFYSYFTVEEQAQIKNSFSGRIRESIANTMAEIPANGDGKPNFGADIQKSSFENVVEIYENELPLSSAGQGRETLIKTNMMIRGKSNANVIAIEEPENHLSHSSLTSMIDLIEKAQKGKQIILTSHSSRIASGVGLNNVVVLSKDNEQVFSLKDLSASTANLFRKLPTDSLLHFILSKKAILVEGPSELLYMDCFFSRLFPNKSLGQEGISVISVNGLSFFAYAEVGAILGKKIAIVTDNDNKKDKEKSFKQKLLGLYKSTDNAQVFMEPDLHLRTFELCLFHDNEELIKKILPLEEGHDYSHPYSNGERYLGKMLNNKVDSALLLSRSPDFRQLAKIPQYIENALRFLVNE